MSEACGETAVGAAICSVEEFTVLRIGKRSFGECSKYKDIIETNFKPTMLDFRRDINDKKTRYLLDTFDMRSSAYA